LPLPWQRYYIPLTPFASIWTAYGIATIFKTFNEKLNKI
jgi:hypothetical protein